MSLKRPAVGEEFCKAGFFLVQKYESKLTEINQIKLNKDMI